MPDVGVVSVSLRKSIEKGVDVIKRVLSAIPRKKLPIKKARYGAFSTRRVVLARLY
jgi:hypothetical protein